MMDDKPFWARMLAICAIFFLLIFTLNHMLPGGIKGLFDQSSTDYFVQTPQGCQTQTRDNDSGAVLSVRPCGQAQAPRDGE